MLANLKNNADAPNPNPPVSLLQDELRITHLSSDVKTGLAKEVKSLMDRGLIGEVNSHGYIKIASPGIGKPRFLLSSFMICGRRNGVTIWMVLFGTVCAGSGHGHRLGGWVHSDRSDRVVLVYSQDEYDYNKQSFQDRFADRENEMEGIL